MLSLLGSLAQEESNSTSQDTTQGIVYRFQEGKVRVNHKRFLGYTKDDAGQLVIVPEEAEVVRRIYEEYLEGYGCNKIARGIESDGILTGAGNKNWHESSIIKMLKNEKYMGDALLQKTYTVDFLSKKRVINKGHAQQYYVEDRHPAIISKEMFAAIQAEFARRSNLRGYSKTDKSAYTSSYPFSGKLLCHSCGSKFTRRTPGTGKYKIMKWMCINHYNNGNNACTMQAIHERAVEKAFLLGR